MNTHDRVYDVGVNINNAFKVVFDTYQNLKKLLDEMDSVAQEAGFFSLLRSSFGFLRWKSDVQSHGWFPTDFIKLYQMVSDPEHPTISDLRLAPVYAVEIAFLQGDRPIVVAARLDYDFDMAGWESLPRTSDHGNFYWPLVGRESDFTEIPHPVYTIRQIQNHKKKFYLGIDKVVLTRKDLVSVDSKDSIASVIFGTLLELAEFQH